MFVKVWSPTFGLSYIPEEVMLKVFIVPALVVIPEVRPRAIPSVGKDAADFTAPYHGSCLSNQQLTGLCAVRPQHRIGFAYGRSIDKVVLVEQHMCLGCYA